MIYPLTFSSLGCLAELVAQLQVLLVLLVLPAQVPVLVVLVVAAQVPAQVQALVVAQNRESLHRQR